MIQNVVIWLDDLRDPETQKYKELIESVCWGESIDLVLWVKTEEQFRIAFLNVMNASDQQVLGVFFDNDLGPRDECGEGYSAFCWMENYLHENNMRRSIVLFLLYAQTANPVAHKKFSSGFSALRNWFNS